MIISLDMGDKSLEKRTEKTFERLSDIPGEDGHKHNFVKKNSINFYGKSWGGIRETKDGDIPSYYECECGEKVYSCPNCNYVLGSPERRQVGSRPMGRRIPPCDRNPIGDLEGYKEPYGEEYRCKICGEFLGQFIIVPTRRYVA